MPSSAVKVRHSAPHRRLPIVGAGLPTASLLPRFDVAAESALGRDILDLTYGEPDLPWRNARSQGLVGRTAPGSRQDQRAAEDT
jgi:hypothetical protein